MKIALRCAAPLLWFLVAASPAPADSPLTETPFHEAYSDVEIVVIAADLGSVTREIGAFLANPDNPIDLKAAVINALGWSLEGKDNAGQFISYLSMHQGIRENQLSPELEFCVGYMLALDDYFDPRPALPYLDRARDAMPRSATVTLVRALVRAQIEFEEDWCQVWREIEYAVDLYNEGYLDMDLRLEAARTVTEYMRLYAAYCDEELPADHPWFE